MSKAQLHGLISSLKTYVEEELNDPTSIGYDADAEIEAAWQSYKSKMLKEEVEKTRRGQGDEERGKNINAAQVIENASETHIWRSIGTVSTVELQARNRRPSGDLVGSPQRRERRGEHSDRNINRPRAVEAHRSLMARGEFGWKEGMWINPVEPPEGFTKDEKLQLIRVYTQHCERCRLCEKRTKVVCDDGCPDAKLMFVGEGPGRDEDLQGIPFVGAAGQLLSDMIAAMKMDRQQDVFIANVVKCRPENNRDPLPDEIQKCLPLLLRQIDAVKPKVIVVLGRVALSALLPDVQPSITKVRGNWYELKTPENLVIPVMPTFHPAYILHSASRGKEAKRLVWGDLQMVMKRLAEEDVKIGRANEKEVEGKNE